MVSRRIPVTGLLSLLLAATLFASRDPPWPCSLLPYAVDARERCTLEPIPGQDREDRFLCFEAGGRAVFTDVPLGDSGYGVARVWARNDSSSVRYLTLTGGIPPDTFTLARVAILPADGSTAPACFPCTLKSVRSGVTWLTLSCDAQPAGRHCAVSQVSFACRDKPYLHMYTAEEGGWYAAGRRELVCWTPDSYTCSLEVAYRLNIGDWLPIRTIAPHTHGAGSSGTPDNFFFWNIPDPRSDSALCQLRVRTLSCPPDSTARDTSPTFRIYRPPRDALDTIPLWTRVFSTTPHYWYKMADTHGWALLDSVIFPDDSAVTAVSIQGEMTGQPAGACSGALQLTIDSVSGPVICTLTVNARSQAPSYVAGLMRRPSGVHDLYLAGRRETPWDDSVNKCVFHAYSLVFLTDTAGRHPTAGEGPGCRQLSAGRHGIRYDVGGRMLRLDIELTRSTPVTAVIYGLNGARLATLVDRTFQAGMWTLEWKRGDAALRALGPGYFVTKIDLGAHTWSHVTAVPH